MKYPPSIISVGGWAVPNSAKTAYALLFNLKPANPISGKTCNLRVVNFCVDGLNESTGTGVPSTKMTFAVSLDLPQQWGYRISDTTTTTGIAAGEGEINRVVGLYTKAYPQIAYPRCILSIANGPQTVELSIRSVTGDTFDTTTYPKLFLSAVFEVQELSP